MKININIFFVSFIVLSLSITQVHAKRKRPDRRTYKPLIESLKKTNKPVVKSVKKTNKSVKKTNKPVLKSVKKTNKPIVKSVKYNKNVDIIIYKHSNNLNSSFPVTVRLPKNHKEGI
jgi:NCAIR mutase (PurE)-related protein